MHAYFRNHQLYLAEKFHWLDVQVIKNSKRSLMKIESWRLLLHSHDSNKQTALVEKLVKDTLLTPVLNKTVLHQEGFYQSNLCN
jgi:hypothetical protein